MKYHLGTPVVLADFTLIAAATTCGSTATTYWPEFSTTQVYEPQITLPAAPEGYSSGDNLGPAEYTPTTVLSPAECTVIPLGWDTDDSLQLLATVDACGTDGTITLLAHYVYTIGRRLYMHLVRTRLNIFGTLSFVPNIAFWIDNSHLSRAAYVNKCYYKMA